jgi:hypothetical protein
VDVSKEWQWLVPFSCGDSDVRDRACSGWPCTAVGSAMQTGRAYGPGGLCIELRVTLETLLTVLEHRIVCGRWVLCILTQ